MGIYYGDEFAGIKLQCDTRNIYEIKFDVINDKIKEEIHKILENGDYEEISIFIWTSCFSTLDDCEYMIWQHVTKDQLLKEMAKPPKSQYSRHITCGWPSI